MHLHFIVVCAIIVTFTGKKAPTWRSSAVVEREGDCMPGAIRSCAGGVVFCDDQVFLLMSDRGEWVMPKGVIRSENRSNDVALWRVEDEAGIHAEIIGIAGNTRYDFFSESRGREISNRIQWFAMRAEDRSFHVAYEQGFLNGGYYLVEKARTMLTYDGDREILDNAYRIYRETQDKPL